MSDPSPQAAIPNQTPDPVPQPSSTPGNIEKGAGRENVSDEGTTINHPLQPERGEKAPPSPHKDPRSAQIPHLKEENEHQADQNKKEGE